MLNSRRCELSVKRKLVEHWRQMDLLLNLNPLNLLHRHQFSPFYHGGGLGLQVSSCEKSLSAKVTAVKSLWITHRTLTENLIRISWEDVHKAATNGTTAPLKSLGLTLECWNAIICSKSVHRASLYCNLRNLLKKMVGKVFWLILSITFQGYSPPGFPPCKHIVSLKGSFHLGYSFSHCNPPILEGSHVQTLAWYST